MDQPKQMESDTRLLLAFYDSEEATSKVLDQLLKADVPMDRVSLLGRSSSSGDDPLGIYYPSLGERMTGWGKMGAFWGGLWGLFSGALGLFLIPGLAPIVAAGPVVDALVGAAGGASLGGVAMAGAGAVSELGVAVHRMGVPKDQLERYQSLLKSGHYMIMLILPVAEVRERETILKAGSPEHIADYPYVGYLDLPKAVNT